MKTTEQELKNHIKEIVKSTIKTIIGESKPFPSNEFKHFTSPENQILEEALLKEGLTRTYPFEWVKKYIQRNANEDFVDIICHRDSKQFLVTIKQNSPSIKTFKRAMESFGYFCSSEKKRISGILTQFEPKFDEYIKGSEFKKKSGNTFFHVSPIRYVDKILKNGLVPKSKNNFLIYPDRVHLIYNDGNHDNPYMMADMLYTVDGNKHNNGEYALFGVSTKGLDNVKFYRDWNVEDFEAYFTYENIPPQNITFIEQFTANEL